MDGLSVGGAFVYFEIPYDIPIIGRFRITQTVISSLIITILLCVAFILLGRNLKKRPNNRQSLVEIGVEMLMKQVAGAMGKHNLHWTPFIGTIFLSCLCGSYIGLTGFLRSTTADLSCVAVWAVMVSVIIWAINIKNNGLLKWLKGFTEPIFIMTPMNLVSEIAQPLSMAFRQFGNVTGGGIITTILYIALSGASTTLLNLIEKSGWVAAVALVLVGVGMLIWNKKKKGLVKLVIGFLSLILGVGGVLQVSGLFVGLPVLTYGIPAVFSCYFDLFSGFVQAYVFTLLTMAYIGGALPAPKTEEAE